MRRDMQRYLMIELIALIAALAVVSAIMIMTLLPG
ncbi:type IV secretory pathway component VirB8 (plasmid) [Ensifer sp. WSM1721]